MRTFRMVRGGVAFTGLAAISLWIAPGIPSQEPKKPTYAEMVESAKRGDAGVDFAAMRYAFLESGGPYKNGFSNSRELNGLARAKDYEKLLARSNEFISMDFVDIRGHFFAGYALKALGREGEAQKESALAKALVQSILDSGDGKTQKTAYVVINVAEEYALMEWLGIQPNGQGLSAAGPNGPWYDADTGTRNGETITLYFDISKFYGKEFQKQPPH